MAKGKAGYRRVLLKISGEGFCKEGGFGIDGDEVEAIAGQLKAVAEMGVELAVVVGGGNFIRGRTFTDNAHVQRATADYMGMLATILNAVALQDTLEKMGAPTRVCSAIHVEAMCEPFIRRRAIRHLEKKRIVVLAGGTGNPFFTTDTCAALRASELGAAALLKATNVEGVYSDDPKANPDAELFTRLTYQQVIERNLQVMDLSAVDLCRNQKIPIVVFNLKREGNIRRVIAGEPVGTTVGV
jgi:uridylate kinase